VTVPALIPNVYPDPAEMFPEPPMNTEITRSIFVVVRLPAVGVPEVVAKLLWLVSTGDDAFTPENSYSINSPDNDVTVTPALTVFIDNAVRVVGVIDADPALYQT
jgi:hypothetical protein